MSQRLLAALPLRNPRTLSLIPRGAGIWVALGYIVQGVGLDSGSDASTAAFLCSLAVVVCPLLELLDGKKVVVVKYKEAVITHEEADFDNGNKDTYGFHACDTQTPCDDNNHAPF